jgi:hypothetical protein
MLLLGPITFRLPAYKLLAQGFFAVQVSIGPDQSAVSLSTAYSCLPTHACIIPRL